MSARLRIWHQSYTDLATLPRYASRLATHAQAVLGVHVQLDVNGLPPGTPPAATRNAYLERFGDLEICRGVMAAERDRYDAVVLGCFYDPALREARSMVDIPVLGMAETSALVACAYGRRFGLVALSTDEAVAAADLVCGYGLGERLAASVALEGEISEPEIEQLAPSEAASLIETFEGACARCVELGAEVVVPAEGVLNEFLVHEGFRSSPQLPVLDAFGVLWKQAECFVEMHRMLNLGVSRARFYRKPDGVGELSLQRFLVERWAREGTCSRAGGR